MNLNSGKPWSQTALYDLRYWLEHGDSPWSVNTRV